MRNILLLKCIITAIALISCQEFINRDITITSPGLFENDDIVSLVYGNGLFVAGSLNGKRACSADGKNWTVYNGLLWGGNPVLLAYGNDIFIASVSSRIFSSVDGINWTDNNFSIMTSTSTISRPVFGDGKFIISAGTVTVGTSQIIPLFYSNDGINWVSSSFNFSLRDGVFGNGKFVLTGQKAGNLAYSADGAAWTAINFGSRLYYTLTFGNGIFIAGGQDSVIIQSSDGINWTENTNPLFNSGTENDYPAVRTIVFGSGKFLAAGDSGKAAWSTDGTVWFELEVPVFGKDNIRAACYGNGKFVAGGQNGKVAFWNENELCN